MGMEMRFCVGRMLCVAIDNVLLVVKWEGCVEECLVGLLQEVLHCHADVDDEPSRFSSEKGDDEVDAIRLHESLVSFGPHKLSPISRVV